jgi:dynein heavy chain
MPKVEKYGAQPPIELLRQLVDHSFFYDLKEKTKMQVIDFTMLCAMMPPHGGRNKLNERFLRHFNIIGINEQNEETLKSIFSTILDWNFKKQYVKYPIKTKTIYSFIKLLEGFINFTQTLKALFHHLLN